MRITKEMKTDIVTKVLAFKFKAAEADIERRRRELGPLLYRHVVSTEDEVRIKALPDWQQWCHTTQCLVVECEGYTGSYGLTTYPEKYEGYLNSSLSLDDPRPWRYNSSEKLKLKSGHPLFKTFADLYKANLKLQREKQEMREKVRTLLGSCNTVKQLLAAWPEGEQFFPKEVKYSTALVPVTLAHDLTKELGLKSKVSPSTNAVRKAATSK